MQGTVVRKHIPIQCTVAADGSLSRTRTLCLSIALGALAILFIRIHVTCWLMSALMNALMKALMFAVASQGAGQLH